MRITMWVFACMVLLFSLRQTLNAQVLKIGDKFPDLILNSVLNQVDKKLNTADYKGKFLIIDFWGTGCYTCINDFSKIDSLQEQFDSRLQFIAVNKESYDSTLRFFAKRKNLKVPDIPFVTGDTILSRMFPHVFVPHHVWIDSSQTVRYITGGHNATAAHIGKFISGKDLRLSIKKYEPDYFFQDILSGVQKGYGVENICSYSFLIHCLSGISFSNTVTSTAEGNLPNKITRSCSSIEQLLVTAYSEGNKYDIDYENTVIFELKDISKYKYPKNGNDWDNWFTNNAYNYEIVVPPSQSEELYLAMQQDLARLFNVFGSVERREVKCLSIIWNGDSTKLFSKGGIPESTLGKIVEDSIKVMRNLPWHRFASTIKRKAKTRENSMPFIDNTGIHVNIDISLSRLAFDEFNLNALRKELQNYGLEIVEVNCLRDVLVIRDL